MYSLSISSQTNHKALVGLHVLALKDQVEMYSVYVEYRYDVLHF